jgi:hypothetical protein
MLSATNFFGKWWLSAVVTEPKPRKDTAQKKHFSHVTSTPSPDANVVSHQFLWKWWLSAVVTYPKPCKDTAQQRCFSQVTSTLSPDANAFSHQLLWKNGG